MVLMLFRKHLVNGTWVLQKKFKPQFINEDKLASIKKREEKKYPGHMVVFEYYSIPEEELEEFKRTHINLELQK